MNQPSTDLGPLGIIGGLGGLAVAIAEDAVRTGRGVFVLRFEGFEDPRLDPYPGVTLRMGAVAELINAFKIEGCRQLTMAGRIDRPDFRKLKLDMKGLKLLANILIASQKGDDALLSHLIKVLEREGFEIIAPQTASQNLLAPNGNLVGEPNATHLQDLSKGCHIARTIGRLDIGQGTVICDGLVLAVEAQEGTDAMLKRVSELRPELRGTPQTRRGVLVKWPKPDQERRVDLPTIGPETVLGAALAGLAGIGIKTGETFIIDRPRVIELAQSHGLFILCMDEDASPIAA